MPSRVARALKTQVRGFLECFSKPLVLQMKNIVSQEFKRTERLDLVMTKPEDSPSHTIPIRASHSWPTSLKCCSYAMLNSKSCGVIEEGNRISSQLRPVSEQSRMIQKSLVLYSHQFNVALIASSLL